jgi:molybdopterin-guanine dinucleotide biosynthesis protein A
LDLLFLLFLLLLSLPIFTMSNQAHEIVGLLLLGGLSSRMGQDKALLTLRTEGTHGAGVLQTSVIPAQTLLERNLALLAAQCPYGVIVSARDEFQLDRLKARLASDRTPQGTRFILDQPGRDIGPAAGLLSAHAELPDATFLVLAIDFPLVTPTALSDLLSAHISVPSSPVTCYMHASDGAPEPFMAVWTPRALDRLKANVDSGGKTGPCAAAKGIWKDHTGGAGMSEGHGLVRCRDERWLKNTNTPEQWEEVMREEALRGL